MLDLSFNTMKAIVKNVFEFGKELELVKEGDFEKIFSDEKIKAVIPDLKYNIFHLIINQFLWIDDIYRYFINDAQKKVIERVLRFSKHSDIELAHYPERYVGLQLLLYAEDHGKSFSFLIGDTDVFVKRLISLLPKDFLLSKKIKYQKESQIGNFIFNTKYGKVQGGFDYSQIQEVAQDHLFLLRLLNPLIAKALKGKIIVRVEVASDVEHYLLVPISKVHLEDNPYIPFYYKHNLRVINKDPVTQADLDRALERYSLPPKDGGKWVSQFLGKVPKECMKPSGWEISYKKFGYARPKL